jgi:hypothetical protein
MKRARPRAGWRSKDANARAQKRAESSEADDRMRADSCVGETNLRVCRARSHCSGIVIYNENTNSKLQAVRAWRRNT